MNPVFYQGALPHHNEEPKRLRVDYESLDVAGRLRSQLEWVRKNKASLCIQGRIKFRFSDDAWACLWATRDYSRKLQTIYHGILFDSLSLWMQGGQASFQGAVMIDDEYYWARMEPFNTPEGKAIFVISVKTLYHYFLIDED